jgi:chromosome partitioning protein
MTSNYAHIIVFGNEKGGSGKSTAATHVAVGLMRLGYKVGTLDLDARQGTLTGLLRHRWEYIKDKEIDLPYPLHMLIDKSMADTRAEAEAEELNFMQMAIAELETSCDFVVVDTPGTHNHLSVMAHEYADTLVTPVNDSMVDLSVLADIDPKTLEILKPSIYTDMVHEAKMKKFTRINASGQDRKTDMHWIVMRNRRSHLAMKHKEDIDKALENMAQHYDFTYLQGFGERVIFRELYLHGLTLLDLKQTGEKGGSLTMSEIAARQEIRSLIATINPAQYRGYPKTPNNSAA